MSIGNAVRAVASEPVAVLLSREEFHKRIFARLLEKHDPVRNKHKPPSLLLPELRRSIEQWLDADGVAATEREQLMEEVLADYPGLGPLDELFRDETVTEFLIIAHNQVIRRSKDGWLPTSVQFRDREHVRQALKTLFASAAPIGAAPTTSDGGADAMLPNGFRVIAILPPRVMEHSCLAVFRRETPVAKESGTVSHVDRAKAAGTPILRDSGWQMPAATGHWERMKQRIREQFVQRLAASGVTDLSTLPRQQLRKVIAAFVVEFNTTDGLNLDAPAQERMTLDILAGTHQ